MKVGETLIEVVRDDITRQHVDAIVNAANSALCVFSESHACFDVEITESAGFGLEPLVAIYLWEATVQATLALTLNLEPSGRSPE